MSSLGRVMEARRPTTLASRTALATAGALLLGAFPAAAKATLLAATNGGGGPTAAGLDISYVQCGAPVPALTTFAIVGVDGGRASDLNPCLGPSSSYPSYTQSELYWAQTSTTGGTGQPAVSLYANTSDPGNLYANAPVADWPTSGATPYGPCTTTTVVAGSQTYVVGENSDACAWQYGYDMAAQDAAWLTSAADADNAQTPPATVPDAPGSYSWWLDVETANTWQTDTTMNVADLEGMIAALQSAGVTGVGVYAAPSQWNAIVGGTPSTASSLYGVPNWIPGATSYTGAETNCDLASLTGGTVTLTQWSGAFDNDYVCSPA